MNHLSEDTLLLIAYGERAADVHLEHCPDCRTRLAAIERARVAVDWTRTAAMPRRALRWAALVGLAAAAVVAVVLLRPPSVTDNTPLVLVLPRYAVPELTAIDSMLTSLEQERFHAIP
jgi:hypothetical protein